MKKRFSGILLVCASLMVAFLLCEATMRMIGRMRGIDLRLYVKELKSSDRLPETIFTRTPYGISLRPNAQALAVTSDFHVLYTINSHGLRDKEYSYVKPPGVLRVLAFGDSLTFGEGVAYGERFADIPERHFSNVELINFGIPGNSLDHMLLEFVFQGLRYQPDVAILFVHRLLLGRYWAPLIHEGAVDLSSVNPGSFYGGNQTAFMSRSDPFFENEDQGWWRHSYLVSLLRYHVALIVLRRNMRERDKNVIKETIAQEREAVTRNLNGLGSRGENRLEPAGQKQFAPERGGHADQAVAGRGKGMPVSDEGRTRVLLKKFAQICREHKIKLFVVNTAHYGRLDYLKDMASDFVYYDLSDSLNEEAKKYRLTFSIDGHYNRTTHRFISQKIIEMFAVELDVRSSK